MIPLVLLCVLIGVPVLFALIFRVNAIFLFLSLAIGELLVRYISEDAILAVNVFTRAEIVPVAVRLILLLVPVILTLILLKKSMPRNKVVLQIIPLWATGLAVASLTLAHLPEGLAREIYSLPAGDILRQSQNIVISVAAVLTLLLALHEYRHRGKHHGKHHR